MAKRDLIDYFPSLAEAYAGYIRQAVFRVTLTGVLAETEKRVRSEMSQQNYDGSLNPLLRNDNYEKDVREREKEVYYENFRKILHCRIELADWYRWNSDESYAERSEKESLRYGIAAAYAVPKHFINKFAAKKVKKVGGRTVSKVIASKTIPTDIGKFVGRRGLGTTSILRSINGLFDMSVNPTEMAIGKMHDILQQKIGIEGVDTSFNNQATRSFYSGMLHLDKGHEKYLGWGLDALDVATDALKFADVAKLVEEVSINAFTAGCHYVDAKRERKAITERNRAWNNMTEEIKRFIQKDIASLSDGELTGLCNLLDVKY